MKKLHLLMLLAAASLLAACERGDDAAGLPPPPPTAVFPANQFLSFPNTQASLAPGDYSLVAATQEAGQSGAYKLVVTFDDGRSQEFNGSWTASGGPDPADGDNPRHALRLNIAGGLRASLQRTAAAVNGAPQLYLLDRSNKVVAQAAGVQNGNDWQARIDLPASTIDSRQYSEAYYATIDPRNERDTLDKWKSANGFDAGEDTNVVFLDRHDLGYGRNMHLRRKADGSIAVFVENYRVGYFPGEQYGDINLDAAIARAGSFRDGYNAIEWGPIDRNGDGNADDLNGDGSITGADFFTRFYNFAPRPPFQRQLAADMDGRGQKAVPTLCISCHGGRALPLLPDGSFARGGDTLARLQPLDVESFGHSTQGGYTRAEQEAGFKLINRAVYDSYAPNLTPPLGHWSSATARAQIEHYYGGADFPEDHFSGGFVPAGWQPNASATPPVPETAPALYTEVIGPYCMSCHLLRGNVHQNNVDLTSYAKFLGYARAIQGLVFDRGSMPLARIPHERLQKNEAALEQLAAAIPGFNRRDPDGKLLRPGRPIAAAGPDRRSPSPVQVSGAASLLAAHYQWSILSQPAGAVAALDDATAPRVQLTADTNGAYTLELRVTDREGHVSPADTVVVTIDNAMPLAPRDITYEAHIKPFLAINCVGCHRTPNPPPFNTGFFMNDPVAGENRNVYQTLRSRIDFLRPEFSPLLTKPAGSNHFAGLRPGFDTTADRTNYDLFLNWILEGAREN